MWVQSLGEEEPLKKKTATHSSILNLICVVDAFGQPVVSMDHFSEFFFFFWSRMMFLITQKKIDKAIKKTNYIEIHLPKC